MKNKTLRTNSMKLKTVIAASLAISVLFAFTGCGVNGNIDDYAVNTGYGDSDTVKSSSGVSKDSIKVGVIHLSDPAEGSGYTYTHDIGIMGMQQNLGLSDSQIIRKINVNDS